MSVRVRFAPSPTGYLHIGGLRTALFNYLYARKNGGQFILRIEDTDRTRLVPDALDDIMAMLRWLGIEWDEGPDVGGPAGPYVQSERLDLYARYADELLASGGAYRCFCTGERLAALREEQEKNKSGSGYDRRCRDLDPAQAARRHAAGEVSVIRFAAPLSGTTGFRDFLRGEVVFENTTIDDLVLLKADGFPTYHLANIVDDHLMGITHVMRGEEWISSTPKHVLLYAAFGWTPPEFVHLPVILSPHGGKLSKRDGATQVREFVEQGYLPEAMVNFLALLGWSLDGSTSEIDMATLKGVFVLEKIGMASPVFDRAKLDDYNGKNIRALPPAELARRLVPYAEAAGLVAPGDAAALAYLAKIVPLFQERLVLLSAFPQAAACFFAERLAYPEAAAFAGKKGSVESAARVLALAPERFAALTDWEDAALEETGRALAAELAIEPGQAFAPLRVAVTGSAVSPPLFATMRVLGRERVLARLAAAAAHLG